MSQIDKPSSIGSFTCRLSYYHVLNKIVLFPVLFIFFQEFYEYEVCKIYLLQKYNIQEFIEL